MAFNNDALITISKKWFSEASPVNGVAPTQVFTFSATPISEETITITDIDDSTEVYQFMANGSTPTDSSYHLVELEATPTIDTALVELQSVVEANSSIVIGVASTPNDTLTVTYATLKDEVLTATVGTEGNSVGTTETLTFGSWGATTLAGGVYATPCKTSNATIVISGTRYIASKPISKYDTSGWISVTEVVV